MSNPNDSGEIRVTQRFEPNPVGDRVTVRFPMDPVTERFVPDATNVDAGAPAVPARAPVSLRVGELVDDRYRIEEGPLGEPTGEAEVFRCLDTGTNESVALKYYLDNIKPKDNILQSLINVHHPDVVTLRAYGTWAGRFYEIMDFCEGGNLMEHMPFDEAALCEIVRETVAGLQYLHSQGIVHRDIKPNNLFFRDRERRDVVIGDFGVSSFLENPDRVRKTSTAGFFTLDYAAPELIDGKEVSPKTDYYGLGITLLHLYQGTSPFAGLDTNAVLGCHFRSRVPRPRDLSKEFGTLINGLLRIRSASRWGYRQVMSWLNHEAILTDDGLPDHDEVRVGKHLAYRSFPEITTPAKMAQRLRDFDVARDLKRGRISQWVMYFDTELGGRVAQLEEDYIERPELGIFKLRYLLDPTLPLEVGDSKVYSVAQLVKLIARHDSAHQTDLEGLLYSESIETWVHAMQTDAEGAELAARIADIRTRITDRSLGLFALLFTLDPHRPLALSRYVAIKKLDDIEQALAEHREVIQCVARYLYMGYFVEWLRASFPHQVEDIAFLEQCAHRYRDKKELGVFALRCHLYPAISFMVGGETAETPKDLAALICRNQRTSEHGLALLMEGWIEAWLVHTGRLKDTEAFAAVVQDLTISPRRKQEAVLHILDPGLAWPVPAADVDFIDAGAITTEAVKTFTIGIFNAGRGYLAGTVLLEEAEGEAGGFAMRERAIEGEPVEVELTISARGLPVGSRHTATIVVSTNAGQLRIPVQYRVTVPLGGMIVRTLFIGLIVGQVLGLARLALSFLSPQYASNVMEWLGSDALAQQTGLGWVIPVGLVFLAVIAGLSYFLYSMYQVHR